MFSSFSNTNNTSTLWPWLSTDKLELNDANIAKICNLVGMKRSYKKGDVITHIGEHVLGLYFLNKGEVVSTFLSENGLEKIVFIYKPPCFFNESPLFNKLRTKMEIRALTDCTITFINRSNLDKLISSNQLFNYFLLKYMARKMYVIADQLIDIINLTPTKKIYKILLFYAQEQGVYKNGQITIKISQEKLAKISGLHRVTVARVFKKLKQRGIIKKTGKSYVVMVSDVFSNNDDL